jgi:hypothetical protein
MVFFINSTDERPKSLLDFAHQQRLAIFGVKKHIILKPLRGEKPSRTFPIISPMNPLDTSEANATTMELQTLSGLCIHELKDQNLGRGQWSMRVYSRLKPQTK